MLVSFTVLRSLKKFEDSRLTSDKYQLRSSEVLD